MTRPLAWDRLLAAAAPQIERLEKRCVAAGRAPTALLGDCASCGPGVPLTSAFCWPEMGGVYGGCAGCGSTVRVSEGSLHSLGGEG